MSRKVLPFVALVVVVFAVAACSLARAKDGPKEKEGASVATPLPTWRFLRSSSSMRESAGIAIASVPNGGAMLAFLADADDRALVVLDGSTLDLVSRVELEGTPQSVLVLGNGEIAVTLVDKDLVLFFAAQGNEPTLVETRRLRVASEPRALALTPDDRTLFVATGATHRVDAFDVGSLERRFTKDVAREPRAIAVAANGKTALVTHATQSEITVIDFDAPPPKRAPVDLALPAAVGSCVYNDPTRFARHANTLVRRTTKTRSGANAESFLVPVVQSAPRGASKHGYGAGEMPEQLIALPQTSPEYGIAAFDLREVRMDPVESNVDRYAAAHFLVEDCLLPRASIATERGVLVACEGQSHVVEVERDDLGWAHVISRFEVGRGPSALAALPDRKQAIAWSRFDRKAALLPMKDLGLEGSILAKPRSRDPERTKVIARAHPIDERTSRGAEIFHRTGDPKISRAGVACATCHPDGGDDGIVWMAPGGKRRTLALAGNVFPERTSYGWLGAEKSIATRIAATIERLQGKGLKPEDVDALSAYLFSLPAQRSERATEAAAAHGAEIFRSSRAGCTSCHVVGASLSDRQAHDVGSGAAFVTPSLVGVGGRRALFHDGRYADFEALLRGAKGMGGAAELDDAERADLAAFLRTL
jgi:mono/diheme cytochrome c family protein